MGSIPEVMQLCRLCLMKDDVNNLIFEDEDNISQIFLKISACLPIKVARDDTLPKKICDSCSYKLELLYDFLHTVTTSEKQLITLLKQLEDDPLTKVISHLPLTRIANVAPIVMKQELPDLIDTHSVDDITPSEDLNITVETEDYVLQQQQSPYESVEFEFQQERFIDNNDMNIDDSTTDIGSGAIKRKRQNIALKRLPTDLDSDEYEEDEDNDFELPDSKIAKIEDDSEVEQTPFVHLTSTTSDNDQPGPSGLGKTVGDGSFRPLSALISDTVHQTIYECEVCTETFTSKNDFLAHHMSQFGQTFTCCRCSLQYKTATELYNHYEVHKNNTIIMEGNDNSTELDYSEDVKTVISIPNEPNNEANELFYILDGTQCVNEIVIEDENDIQEIDDSETSENNSENFRIIHVEHGYMLPSIFKGQLEAKRRYTRKESVSESCTDLSKEISEPSELDTSKNTYLSVPKARPKRRHEVPDFSATSYIVLNPNADIDIMHYKCLRCEQLFINKFTFFRHIEKGKCYINSCDVCSASFKKNSEFYEHYLDKHRDRAICNFCFRTFMYEKNVKEHMLRHLDQFRHRCEECNKGFYTVREYRNHYKNRHMGIRHKCGVCGRSFADEYYFKRHVATHEKALSK